MNPEPTRRLQRVTSIAAIAWAFSAIVFSLYSVLPSTTELVLPVTPSFVGGIAVIEGASDEAIALGVEPGDRLLSIDGQPASLDVRRTFAALSVDTGNEYRIRKKDGREWVVQLHPVVEERDRHPLNSLVFLGLLFVSILYLAVGVGVWRNRKGHPGAWAMLIFCSMMSALVSTILQAEMNPWSVSGLVATLPLMGAAAFHLFTVYPIEPLWIARNPNIRGLLYGLALLISALVLGQQLAGRASAWVPALALSYAVVLLVVSLGILTSERGRARAAGIGVRADLMLIAGCLSFLPVTFALISEFFLQISFPWYLTLLWVVIFPVAVGYGMLKRRPYDIRFLAKSSVAYGVATFTITGLFAFLITFADELIVRSAVRLRSAQIAFLFLAILAFNPLRERLQGLVDRLFDRDRALYREAVQEISEAMVSTLSLDEITDRILVAVTDTMGLRRAMVLLLDESERHLHPIAWRGDWDDGATRDDIPSTHPILKVLAARREDLTRVDFSEEPDVATRELCLAIYDQLKIELLVPIVFGEDLLGAIAVGHKISGERLAWEDRQHLHTLANQSSIAIENAKAFDEIARLNESLEARVETRTRELREAQNQLMQSEKMNSLGQIVAGVAHELNNPIGFVHANLQLLSSLLDKLEETKRKGGDETQLREDIARLLERSQEGTQRVKRIVMDLRSFSRMDQNEMEMANLETEMDRTLALMEPRLKDRIQVRRHYAGIPEVFCHPGQLNQVFLNLLMNACDVLSSEGHIDVSTSPTDFGVRLEVTDDGPGIEPDIQSRIFDPFFTTKAVGSGTGLGLSLSHSTIQRHGGRILVSSDPGRGTSFVIDLPLDGTNREA